jgi:carbamoyl-phosphate synthase large subunit
MNVVITSASRKVGLVRAFQRAVAAEGGGRVIAADVSPLAAALYVADAPALVPRSDDPEFADALLALCRRYDARLVVPTRDEELPILAAAAGRFAAAGIHVLVPPPAVVRTCQDKLRFLEACAAAGLETPARLDPAHPGRFPVFVKPRFGKGSRGVARVDGPDELAAVLRRTPEPIVQELVEAPEFTVDLFADLDGQVLSAVPRERMVIFGGESFVSRVVRSPAIERASLRLSQSLGLTGHATIQCFLRAEQVLFIEVNPRYGGAAHLSFAAGAPSPQFAVRRLLGRPVERAVDAFRDGLVMLRFTDDVYLEPAQLVAEGDR